MSTKEGQLFAKLSDLESKFEIITKYSNEIETIQNYSEKKKRQGELSELESSAKNLQELILLEFENDKEKKDIQINAKDKDGNTFFHYAAKIGDAKLYQLLTYRDRDLNTRIKNNIGQTAVDIKDSTGMTLLHHAASSNFAELVKYLINNGAQIEASDVLGQTALHHAAIDSSTESAKILIGFGANVNAVTEKDNRKPLRYAIFGGSLEIVKLIVNKYDELGTDLNEFVNDNKDTYLHRAIDKVNRYHQSASYDRIDVDANVAEERYNNCLEIITFLVKSGMNLGIKNSEGKTAVETTNNKTLQDVIKFCLTNEQKKQLKDEGKDLDEILKDIKFALHYETGYKKYEKKIESLNLPDSIKDFLLGNNANHEKDQESAKDSKEIDAKPQINSNSWVNTVSNTVSSWHRS